MSCRLVMNALLKRGNHERSSPCTLSWSQSSFSCGIWLSDSGLDVGVGCLNSLCWQSLSIRQKMMYDCSCSSTRLEEEGWAGISICFRSWSFVTDSSRRRSRVLIVIRLDHESRSTTTELVIVPSLSRRRHCDAATENLRLMILLSDILFTWYRVIWNELWLCTGGNIRYR